MANATSQGTTGSRQPYRAPRDEKIAGALGQLRYFFFENLKDSPNQSVTHPPFDFVRAITDGRLASKSILVLQEAARLPLSLRSSIDSAR